MFSLPKLPTQLPDAFGLLGDGAKLNFRTSSTGVRRLAEHKDISPADDAYWSQYVTLFDSASDAFTLISPNDIYRALLLCPQNVSTLLHYLISKLSMLKGDHTFPSPPPSISSSLNPLNSLQISITGSAGSRNPTKELLNCVRVLSRVLPVLFGLETGGWEDEILWKRLASSRPGPREYGATTGGTADSTSQFVIEDDDDDEATSSMLPRTPQQPAGAQEGPSLAEKLIDTLVHLLFCCGFTLPVKAQVDHHKYQYIIWEKGVGSTVTPSATSREQSYIDNNRTEILRLILVLLSKQIYQSPSSILSMPTRYTQYFVQKVSRKLVLTTLCSLLNVIVNSPSTHTQNSGLSAGIAGVGKGITRGFNQLPYTQGWNGEDTRDGLVSISVQVLILLLDYQSFNARDMPSGATSPNSQATPMVSSSGSSSASQHGLMSPVTSQQGVEDRIPSPKTNHFRYFLSKIHRPADLRYLLDGTLAILGEELLKREGILSMGLGALEGVGVKSRPTASKASMQEVLILLWKLFDINRKFRAHAVEGDRAVDVVAVVLCYFLELKDKPKSSGICRALSYMVQSLSAEPSFGTQISLAPIRITLPTKWNVVGTAADFFISAIYFIVSNATTFASSSSNNQSPGIFSSLYPALVISIANVAPYLKNVSIGSSNKLIQLAAAFSDPRLLFAEEGNPRLIYFMLDGINSVLYHHPSDNPNLLYSLLRAHVVFQDLGTLTLSRGLRDIKHREEEDKDGPPKANGKRTSRDQAEQAHEEKARLLAAEGRSLPSFEGLAQESASTGPLANTLLANSMDSLSIASPPPTGTSNWAGPSGTAGYVAEPSEKARGKMRQIHESTDISSSIERAAAIAAGRNGFIPTQEWVTSWQQGLPLDPILLTISELLPKIQEIQSSMNRPSTSPATLDFLRVVDFKTILPQRPTVSARPFVWTDSSIVWLTSLTWGEIYVQNISPLGIWNNTNVRLFYVKQAQPQQRQITETVSNVMGGFLGRRDSSSRGRA